MPRKTRAQRDRESVLFRYEVAFKVDPSQTARIIEFSKTIPNNNYSDDDEHQLQTAVMDIVGEILFEALEGHLPIEVLQESMTSPAPMPAKYLKDQSMDLCSYIEDWHEQNHKANVLLRASQYANVV